VGSQRAAIENSELARTFQVRDTAPSIFLLGNMGAAQLLKYSVEKFKEAVDMIKADGLAIHFNVTQEFAQPEGDKEWKGIYEKLKVLCSELGHPVIVKETGCGISGKVASRLEAAGVAAIDVAGAGGTSWPKVEAYRKGEPESFSEWGIPTALCLKECREAVKMPLIASGGIRTGIDVAKAIAMGADLAGMALPLLKPATESKEAVIKVLEKVIGDLKKTMVFVGARNIEGLKKVKYTLP
jgi:isopentenyl-diphosphate delta-isomerase